MWSMLASPLIMGNDIRSASEETLRILTNQEVIAINQDPLGIQGLRFSNEAQLEIWIKPLANDEWAVSFINMKDTPYDLEFDWMKHEMGDDLNKRSIDLKKQNYEIRDLIGQKAMGDTKSPLKATIGVHDVLLIKLTGKK